MGKNILFSLLIWSCLCSAMETDQCRQLESLHRNTALTLPTVLVNCPPGELHSTASAVMDARADFLGHP
jgi:hypothetical protein